MQGLIEGRTDIGVMKLHRVVLDLRLSNCSKRNSSWFQPIPRETLNLNPAMYMSIGDRNSMPDTAHASLISPAHRYPRISAGWDCNTFWKMAVPAIFQADRAAPPQSQAAGLIGGAPEFSMPAYVVYPLEYDRDLFGSALEIMHRIANPEAKMAARKRTAKRAAEKRR